MSAGASVVTYTVDAESADELRRRVEEYLVPAARQTKGYRGFLLLDQGDGKRLALLLFGSVEDVGPAQQALTPVGRDHTYALMSGPAVGSVGTVLVGDGVFADVAKR
jgi:hypothetical protein